MGKIAILPKELDAGSLSRHLLVERSMPANYMADYSILGILVDRLDEAIRLLGQHRFDIIVKNQCGEIAVNGPGQVRELFRILQSGGLDFGVADLADGIYQG